VKRPHRYPGRKWIDDRKVFTGILFVLKISRLGGSAVGLGCGSWDDLLAAAARAAAGGGLAAPSRVLLAKLRESTRSIGRALSSHSAQVPAVLGS
jgi:hypothetical protein